MSNLKNKTRLLMGEEAANVGEAAAGRTMASALRQPVLRHEVAKGRTPTERSIQAAERAALEKETNFETLAEMIGTRAARRLTAEHGGRRLYLPERLSHRHPLIKLLERRGAEILQEAFGPGWMSVPLGPSATALQRRRRIQAMSDAGYTVVAIAETLGIHTRTVERHRAAIKAEEAADKAARASKG